MQNIKTNLISTPTIAVPDNFSALHLAHISWNLYSENAPTHFANEFTVHDGGDFAMYNIGDSKDISEHFYDSAFAIADSVRKDIDYSIQDAFYMLDDFWGDTVVREDVSSQLQYAIEEFVNSTDYDKYTQYILKDYAYLVEESAEHLPQQIAQLEKQLAQLRTKQSA